MQALGVRLGLFHAADGSVDIVAATLAAAALTLSAAIGCAASLLCRCAVWRAAWRTAAWCARTLFRLAHLFVLAVVLAALLDYGFVHVLRRHAFAYGLLSATTVLAIEHIAFRTVHGHWLYAGPRPNKIRALHY